MHEKRLYDFIDTHTPCRIEINNTIYFPNLLMGITPMGNHLGKSFSRLEFALQKAFQTSGRAYWHVTEDNEEFSDYCNNRIGLHHVRQALDETELGLYAQPIVTLANGQKTRKCEILLRHYQTEKDIHSPAKILQYADFNKVSQDIDLYVITLLCQNFHKISNEIDTISLNLTGASFASPRFVGLLNDIVTRYDIPGEKIILEVTETIANQNITKAMRTMEKFKALGFKLALDDIGIGSSSFHNLSHFPVDFYKIDRLYCEEILSKPESRQFVQLIIDIGKSRGKKSSPKEFQTKKP